ncbi:hypothetical protein A3305_07485 (plasmid) [Rickettsia amblyommatis]|uniref:TPR repeat-containing protein n=2 Tax=Rickettsia amblyommatis TaxID=33989 RepID=H8K687_RICAG|nr:hypothetical protein [Rickettsia amblyommatis]ADD14609.1 TPR repeat-containing protein [Rickettsia amblyommatis str. AaR/SC]AFC70398.1 TPR repeat-containing protein [Rickettsia amblyommatis str. GAT-30V]ALA62284.1 hypothetical protein AL573_07355 [Rickettsia amblyommatis]ARD88202.1 hypothetical protein A3305_07485 [Rickettsia amblyommatis]KJV98531.1 putative tPR repeat-containing protein [Rickettsia amblyommatis str. Darkwater]
MIKVTQTARLVHISYDPNVTSFVDQACNADNADHDNQSSSKLPTAKTITVLISFLKLSKYDDEWLRVGKQLLLLQRPTDKRRCYRSVLLCFKSVIKTHSDNYVAYYFSGITLCLLGSYDEAIKMFDMSLRYNKEKSTALVHTFI